MIELGACAGCQNDTFVLRGETSYSLTLDASGEVLDRSASDAFDGDVECLSCGETHKKLDDLSKEDSSFVENQLFGEEE